MELPTAQRAGFTLVEVLIAIVMTAVIGAAATGLFVSQSRFYDEQQRVGEARSVARAAVNIMLADLRMVEQQHGVIAIADDSIKVYAPVGMAVACAGALTKIDAALLPVDSALWASAQPSAFSVRNIATGAYAAPQAITLGGVATTGGGTCSGASIDYASISAQPIEISSLVSAVGLTPGSAIMLLQEVTYTFKDSAHPNALAGQLGLFRRTASGEEEVAMPFDEDAHFRFFVGGASNSTSASSISDLSTVNGVEIHLTAQVERPEASTGERTRTAPVVTAVFFRN